MRNYLGSLKYSNQTYWRIDICWNAPTSASRSMPRGLQPFALWTHVADATFLLVEYLKFCGEVLTYTTRTKEFYQVARSLLFIWDDHHYLAFIYCCILRKQKNVLPPHKVWRAPLCVVKTLCLSEAETGKKSQKLVFYTEGNKGFFSSRIPDRFPRWSGNTAKGVSWLPREPNIRNKG